MRLRAAVVGTPGKPIMLGILSRLVQAILGEEEISIRVPLVRLDDTSGFISVETKRKGYRYEKRDQKIILKRVDPLAVVAGLPPLYYFSGIVTPSANGAVLNGRILMSTLSKSFILVWGSLVVLAFLGIVIWAILLVGQFIVSSSPTIKEDLTSVGFMTGGVSALGFFGVLVIAVARLVSRRQKQKLISFLRRAEDTGLTSQAA